MVDAAVGLQNKGHSVVMYTSHHDKNHCFQETRDGTLNVEVAVSKIRCFLLSPSSGVWGLSPSAPPRKVSHPVCNAPRDSSSLGERMLVHRTIEKSSAFVSDADSLKVILLTQSHYDVIIVDQLSVLVTSGGCSRDLTSVFVLLQVPVPILLATGSKIVFYCHFPDLKLSGR